MKVTLTKHFEAWFRGLRDSKARYRIQARIDRLEFGGFGDVKSIGDGVSEMRIHHGPGYRLYYTLRGEDLVILLCGGNKGSQPRDIELAKRLARGLA